MSTKVYNSLFMSARPPSEDEGIMNLGKHCHKCSELDFLPFQCEFCNHTYCSKHRSTEVHGCVGRPERKGGLTYAGPTAASLFPDRAQHSKQLDKLLRESSPRATNIGHDGKSTPFMKLTKFLHIQRVKRQSQKSFFGKKKAPNPVVELAALKKVAKGPLVPVADRVYLWALYINRNEEELDKISEEAERRGVWVLKNWSVGRALDSIADTLGIMNHNNSTQQTSERLQLFRVQGDEPVALDTSRKVSSLASGAALYLVRGSIA